MKISKHDALIWFSFFASIEDETLSSRQMEIVYATLAQIEDVVEKGHQDRLNKLHSLKSLSGRTLYWGEDFKFPGGCKSCLLGSGLSAVRKTNRCNISCPFCYNFGELDQQEPIGEDLWEIGGSRYRIEDLDLLFSIQKKPTGVAYVYLEPFMEIEKYEPIIRKFHEAGVYQHMYTNGTLANKENLRMLGNAGLDELRFNLGATNTSNHVITAMKIAKHFIPRVGIETPMTPDFFTQFLQKREKIFETGIDFINCAELHLTVNNIVNYLGENLYMSRLGYISPIWSRNLTLDLMKIAEDEHFPLLIHDCSNRTKLARDLHLGARENGWFGASSYTREFDIIPYEAFLPVLEDPNFLFLEEEPLPEGYRPGDLAF